MRRAGGTSFTVLAGAAGAAAAWPDLASAHVGGGAYILLLPTHLYVAGGAIVVAASFALIALAPPGLFSRLEALSVRWRAPARPWGEAVSTAASLLSLAAIVLLVAAGLLGSRDPLTNPLPLFVWAVWWIGFTYLHAAFGDVWAHVNPWIGLYRLLTAAGRLRRRREHPPLRYPTWAGHWPAVAGFAAFAWFELIHPAPADPAVLASLAASYLLFHLGGVLAFGEGWLRRAEPFTVFFGMVSWLAPLGARVPGRSTPGPAPAREVELTLPSLRLLRAEAPAPSLAVFVLLVLASVSFDGLSRTFAWLGLLGANPLAYPGRTALMAANTLGFLALFGGAGAGLRGGRAAPGGSGRHPRPDGPARRSLRAPPRPHRLRVSLRALPAGLPGGRAVRDPGRIRPLRARVGPPGDARPARGDLVPLGSGPRLRDLAQPGRPDRGRARGGGRRSPTRLALRLAGQAPATLSQLPMLVLMIGYTTLGLWLLSTPAVG